MRIYVILILLLNVSIYAENDFNIKEPSVPKIESNFSNTQSKKNVKKNVLKTIDVDILTFNATVIFVDNTILKGLVSVPQNEIRVKHKKKGFIFEKTIKWNNVKSVKIKEWKPRLVSKNTNKGSLIYYFYAAKYEFKMKNGEIYNYNKNISYLNSLVLTNNDGSTSIYSFFVDYWKSTGKKSGYWENSKNNYFYYPFHNPNKKNFKVINFK